MTDECKHGSLRRSCEICERDEEIDRLIAELSDNNGLSNDHIVLSTLTFNLDYPEGERRLRECLDAPKLKSAVQEFDQWMRARIKYGADGTGAGGPIDEVIRAHLHTIFCEHGIDIWDE